MQLVLLGLKIVIGFVLVLISFSHLVIKLFHVSRVLVRAFMESHGGIALIKNSIELIFALNFLLKLFQRNFIFSVFIVISRDITVASSSLLLVLLRLSWVNSILMFLVQKMMSLVYTSFLISLHLPTLFWVILLKFL